MTKNTYPKITLLLMILRTDMLSASLLCEKEFRDYSKSLQQITVKQWRLIMLDISPITG